jgi:NADPH:quinone reductase-like Zn-dependent oxidoreductase
MTVPASIHPAPPADIAPAPAAGSAPTTAADVGAMSAILQAAYGGPEVLRLGLAPRPTPGPGEVRVRVAAAAIDRGTWHLMTGRPYAMRVMGFGFWRPKARIAGLDLAGTIDAIGPGVTAFAVGDVVCGIGRGSFAEWSIARVEKLARVPEGLDFTSAAALPVSGITAIEVVDAARIEPGQRVLVLGASGGVGTYLVQLAKAAGAHVTGVASRAKLDLVRALGADAALDYATEDPLVGAGRGDARWDVILDVGGNRPIAALRAALTPTGCLVFVGNEQGGDVGGGLGRPLAAMVLAPFVRQRFVMAMSRERSADLARLVALVEAGRVRPVVDRVVALAEVPDALRALEAGEVRGKLAVRVR